MHIRIAPCTGMPIVEDGTEDLLGSLGGVLIDPDTGKVEGIYVHVHSFFHPTEYFCSSLDIVRWGTRIAVRSSDCVQATEEFIRLQSLFQDVRTIIGQKIRTESGRSLGMCRDVQINTETMHVEWIFPKKFFRFGVALPVSDIVEVKPEAIIVRESLMKEPAAEAKQQAPQTLTSPVADAPVSRKSL